MTRDDIIRMAREAGFRAGHMYAELRTDAQTGASECAYRIRARGNA